MAGPTEETGPEPVRRASAPRRAGATKKASGSGSTRSRAPSGASAGSGTSASGASAGGRGPRDSDSAGGPAGIPWRGPFVRAVRGRARIYDRRLQRSHERWPPVARLASAALARPELVLRLLGGAEPVTVDGRVLDRGVQALLALAGRAEARRSGSGSFEPVAMRREMTALARAAMPVRTDVHATGRIVPAADGSPAIPVRVYRRFGTGFGRSHTRRPRPPAIVYYHGGGWVLGDLDSHDAVCRLVAAVSGCIVVAVDYRLAPEHPFPAAVEDAFAAYRWVHAHADELGSEPGQVAVMGDSAGGNLAAVVSLETRGNQAPDVGPPIAQALLYPVTDARYATGSFSSMAEGFYLTRELMEFFRACYLPEGADPASPRVSPLLAEDLRGLPPALVVTAGFDPLRDEGASYAEALAAAGVETEYRCYDDQVHGFISMGVVPDTLALATEVAEAAGRLVRRAAIARAPAD